MNEAVESPPRDLETLFGLLQEAKGMESLAKDERMALEREITRHVEDPPEVGSKTLKAGAYRCTVKFGLSYKADVGVMRGTSGIQSDLLPLKPVPSPYKFDEKAYEALRKSHPDAFKKLSAFVTVKPSKPGLTLKL